MHRLIRGSERAIALMFLVFFAFATVGGPAEAQSVGDAAEEEQWSYELVAQAKTPNDGANDPLEPMNRVILDFNEFINALLLYPIAEMYTLFVPEGAREVVHNMLRNLYSPVVLANDLLQWETDRAWNTTRRLVINSTLGIGGMFDPAKSKFGIEGHTEDLGQTFAVWGVPEGFYLVLPILGPSNPRDAIGKIWLNGYLDPVNSWLSNTDRDEWLYARMSVNGADQLSRVVDDLRNLKETSIDYYAALRSISRQKREADIANGIPKEGAPLPDLKYDFNAEFVQ